MSLKLSMLFMISLAVFSCQKKNADILSISYAKEISKNTEGKQKADVFATKARAFHKQKKYKEALAEWQKAFENYADSKMYYNLGDTLFNLSRFKDAIKAYKCAIELKPKDKKFIYYNIACAYSKLEKASEAFDYLKFAISSGYVYYNQIRVDKDLAYLRNVRNNEIESFIFSYTTGIDSYLTREHLAKLKASTAKKDEASGIEAKALAFYKEKKFTESLALYLHVLKMYASSDTYLGLADVLFALKRYIPAKNADLPMWVLQEHLFIIMKPLMILPNT
jgi:tetratricopeptide (TPR) repeat protein